MRIREVDRFALDRDIDIEKQSGFYSQNPICQSTYLHHENEKKKQEEIK